MKTAEAQEYLDCSFHKENLFKVDLSLYVLL